MSDRDPAFEDWVQRARDVGLEEAAGIAGADLRRAGREWIGPCCLCGGHDRLSISPAKGVWNCRGAEGGNDAISFLQHTMAINFIGACELLTGDKPPRGESSVDHEEVCKRREEAQQKRAARQAEEAKEQADTLAWCKRKFDAAKPITGTHAAAYLERRGLIVIPNWTFDLRFDPSVTYRGYADAVTKEETDLGRFPAMLAAIRDVRGEMIGLHRTFLDPVEPVKLRPPGDPKRNAAKKVAGEQLHGMIRLSEMRRRLGLGEGIETTRSWFVLGRGGDDVAIAAAVSLGNLSGSATGTIKHPITGKAIANGEPDMAKPGVILPAEVDEVILIGDGDSDGPATRQRLLTGGRRFERT